MPYEMPPKALADLVDAPQTPSISLDPRREWLLLMHRPGYPPIEDVARRELRLAGQRIDPDTNGPSRVSHHSGLTLKRVDGGEEQDVRGLPEGVRIGQAYWSPDGSHVAFSVTETDGIGLWFDGLFGGD